MERRRHGQIHVVKNLLALTAQILAYAAVGAFMLLGWAIVAGFVFLIAEWIVSLRDLWLFT